MKFIARYAVAGLVITAAASPLHAQLLYGGVRVGAGVPSGMFGGCGTFAGSANTTSQDGAIGCATTGFGYGLDAGVGLGVLGFYAGYDRIDFGCDATVCGSSGKYRLTGVSAGVRLGVPLIPIVKPWVKAGVTFNEINGTNTGTNATKIATDRNPGYELGAGIDIPVLVLFSLTPQVRYVGQKLDLKGLSVGSKTNVSYYTFDLGLRARTPF
jgi:opacity protein-like surface antigen